MAVLKRSSCLTAFAALCVVGCSGMSAVQSEGAQGKTLSDYLVVEYRDLAAYENETARDPADAEYYVGRALTAAEGGYVEPTLINERSLPEPTWPDLGRARSLLMAALLGRAREPHSWRALARAQAMFDCWLERQDRRDRSTPAEIAACRSGFESAMADLNLAPAGGEGGYVIFFDSASTALDESARAALSGIAGAMQENPALKAVLVGHADTKGDAKANEALSLRRAMAVANALHALSVAPARVQVFGRGECDLMRLTADKTDERKNRRVDVSLIAGQGSGL